MADNYTLCCSNYLNLLLNKPFFHNCFIYIPIFCAIPKRLWCNKELIISIFENIFVISYCRKDYDVFLTINSNWQNTYRREIVKDNCQVNCLYRKQFTVLPHQSPG